ncbi:hypothetical protein LCGC14_2411820 [marine sediment metagenome]|uniref:Uncharacterized protein n=1 Tax=marine sediment metagenome TaxID=412755 RepID=A0A0F9BS85_9ZZZZ
MTRETCPTCSTRTYGQADCVVCDKSFWRRRPDQITCAKKVCKMARQLQVSKHKLAARFLGQTIVCAICKTKTPKTRVNQKTCLKPACVLKHSFSLAKRSR